MEVRLEKPPAMRCKVTGLIYVSHGTRVSVATCGGILGKGYNNHDIQAIHIKFNGCTVNIQSIVVDNPATLYLGPFNNAGIFIGQAAAYENELGSTITGIGTNNYTPILSQVTLKSTGRQLPREALSFLYSGKANIHLQLLVAILLLRLLNLADII